MKKKKKNLNWLLPVMLLLSFAFIASCLIYDSYKAYGTEVVNHFAEDGSHWDTEYWNTEYGCTANGDTCRYYPNYPNIYSAVWEKMKNPAYGLDYITPAFELLTYGIVLFVLCFAVELVSAIARAKKGTHPNIPAWLSLVPLGFTIILYIFTFIIREGIFFNYNFIAKIPLVLFTVAVLIIYYIPKKDKTISVSVGKNGEATDLSNMID